MHKCLRISFNADIPDGFLHDIVLKYARKLGLEGTAQLLGTEKKIRIIACGGKEEVDSFVDLLHKGVSGYHPQEVEIEPFAKGKDYRGVFRVLE